MKFELNAPTATPPGQGQSGSKYPVVPKGNYPAVVETIEVREVNKEIAKWKTNQWDLTFKLRITDGDFAKTPLFQDIALDSGDERDHRSLRDAISAIQGSPLPDTFTFDTDMIPSLTGRQVCVNVDHYWSKKYSEVKHKIGDILPATALGHVVATTTVGSPAVAQPVVQAPANFGVQPGVYQFNADEPF